MRSPRAHVGGGFRTFALAHVPAPAGLAQRPPDLFARARFHHWSLGAGLHRFTAATMAIAEFSLCLTAAPFQASWA